MTLSRPQQMTFKQPRARPALIDEFREVCHDLRMPVRPDVGRVRPGSDVFEFAIIDMFPLPDESVQFTVEFVRATIERGSFDVTIASRLKHVPIMVERGSRCFRDPRI